MTLPVPKVSDWMRVDPNAAAKLPHWSPNFPAAPIEAGSFLRTTRFRLGAADGTSIAVHGWSPRTPATAVVQIAHGIAEHGGRYARLAVALTAAGYEVYAADHRGHGRTAASTADLGFFAEREGWQKCVDDLWTLNRHIAAEHAGLPIVLLGHSMGSFMAQHFISEHGDALAAVVLSGSSGKPAPQAAALRAVMEIERSRLGPRGRSEVINTLVFGAFNAAFEPARTPFDWLSRDSAEVDKYVADPLCGGFQPSIQLWIDLLDALSEIASPARQSRIPKRLPVYVISGTRDRVSDNSRGLEQLIAAYAVAGLERVTRRLYPEARHELFNEINRDEVTQDLIAWLAKAVA